MNEILDWLYVGSVKDAENYAALKAHHIEAVLTLAWPIKHPDITVKRVFFEDGEPIPDEVFYETLSFVRQQRRLGRKILIACSAGISRSPSIAVAVLHELEGYPLVEAFRAVIDTVHLAQPRAVTWNSVCRFYGQIVTPADVWPNPTTSHDGKPPEETQ
ncbi:MAG: dual specificity protein phosphatase family protein [Anaerolineae bacterium]|nr:dual specificity protein phosphatase family protein [Anaerolineae bacterium]